MYIIDDEELAILRAVLSSWLAMTNNPPLPAEEPTEELREAARKLFEGLTSTPQKAHQSEVRDKKPSEFIPCPYYLGVRIYRFPPF